MTKKETSLRVSNRNFNEKYDTLSEVSKNGFIGFPETVEQIMAREQRMSAVKSENKFRVSKEFENERDDLPQNPESPPVSVYPKINTDEITEENGDSPQTVSTNFTAATLSGTNPTGAFPPDNMGAVGPTQFIVAVNGRIVTFNKNTGTADGILNADMDVFFNSVVNGSYTSDPRIRYDRLTGKWFLVIINVSTPNRILISVSNTGTITSSTVWTFYYIAIESVTPTISSTCLADYPTLGLDANALYIGTNNFCGSPSQTFNSCDGYVIRKSSIQSGGTMVLTVFRGLVASSSGAGPYTPQGVDNFDLSATEGYFIGVDNASYGKLMIRRVSTPGGTPTISSSISLTVPTTSSSFTVPHSGNTGGSNGYLDALDDRLYAACIRNGRLWTAHSINVTKAGVASSTSRNREAVRWYEINNLSTTPTLVQSGTIFDTTTSNPRSYWIPSVSISGQGHVAMGFGTAGTNYRINAGTAGRLSGDALGTLQAVNIFTTSTTAYNPSSDPGGTSGRRWGDYSYTSVDPEDNMTMWTVHQFCDAANSYGVRAAKLLAPPPAVLTSANPSSLQLGKASVDITITGTSTNGSGFYDPGSGFSKRLSVSLSNNIVVNSVTYTNPTQIVLNVSTLNATAGNPTLTITNPDGQQVSSSSLFEVVLPVSISSIVSSVFERNVKLEWVTSFEENNAGFYIERINNEELTINKWENAGYVNGHGTTTTEHTYTFEDKKLNSGKYNYRLKQIDFNGNFEYHYFSSTVEVGIPAKFDLSQNYPNPFNPSTKIDFALPQDSRVNITIYDITGREVKTLVNDSKKAGYYTMQINGSDLSSGIYFYRITAKSAMKDFVSTKKMMLVK